jgi:DNA helicase HerA-like ATPase
MATDEEKRMLEYVGRDLADYPYRDLPDFTSVDRARAKAAAPPREERSALRARRPPPVFLGMSQEHRFSWAPSEQPNAFLIALGSSGSGKTELLKVLASELSASIPCVILDFHGDLAVPELKRLSLGASHGINPLANGGEGAEALRAVLRVALPTLGPLQEQLLNEAIGEVLKQSKPTLAELTRWLERRSSDPEVRTPARRLYGAVQSIFDAPVFSAPPVRLAQLLEHGASVDLSRLPRNVQTIAAGAVLAQLFFELRSRGAVERSGALRCFLILDEASLLAESAFFDPLARESRKFGLGFAVATQEARQLSQALADNAATVAVFRLLNRGEALSAARLLPGLRDPEQLQRLAERGECMFRDSAGLRSVRIAAVQSALRKGSHSDE